MISKSKHRNLRADTAQLLFNVLESGQSAREALPNAIHNHPPKDKAWVQEMAFGVFRQLPLLQYWLRQLLDKPLKQKSKIVEHLLMLGMYQLSFTRVSEHAAVSETVSAAEALGAPGLKGLVNAVLRRFIREEWQHKRPDDPQIKSGLPKWLFKRLVAAYPEQQDTLFANMHNKAPIWLRVNQQKLSRQDYATQLETASVSFAIPTDTPDAIILSNTQDITALPGFDEGYFAVQDGAAQHAARLLGARAGDRVLDCCAAPGGKTCHILEQEAGLAACHALDIDEKRLKRVEENLTRLNLKASLIEGDAIDTASWWDGQAYDRILLDAPCSATGVIRRHPDIKWLRKSKDIEALVQIQAEILDAIWLLLKPGGTLLYATCSILPEENAQQIDKFLGRHQDARLDDAMIGTTSETTGWQILPGEQQMDGFYYARLLKSV